jgi:hypothetical protein
VNRCRHTSGILDTLLDPGAVLSAGPHRHLASCDVCASATRRALALEDALAKELTSLRTESLPRSVLATPPIERRSRLPGFLAPTRGLALGLATVALAAVVTLAGFQLLDASGRLTPSADLGSPIAAEASEKPMGGAGAAPPASNGAQAAARVLESDVLFSGLTVVAASPEAPPVQSTYEPNGDEYAVIIRLGWGECDADSCPYTQTRRYRVDAAGTVQLVEQEGDPTDAGGGYPVAYRPDADGELYARVCAQSELDAGCTGAWLGAAEALVRRSSGEEVALAASAPFSGRIDLSVPVGAYVVEARPLDGYETPSPMAISVSGMTATEVDLAYATTTPFAPLVGEVVTEDLVVRSLPMVHDDSIIFGELEPGTQVQVIDGPVLGSGYEWYEVAPAGEAAFERGWVAAASKETPPEEWLRLPDRPMLPGSDCQPIRPTRLPSGAPTGDVRLTWREATWFATWGSEGDLVEQSVGSFGLPDVEQASFEPASIRGAGARVIPTERGTMTVSWQEGDCRYTVWLGPGVTEREAIEYAARY